MGSLTGCIKKAGAALHPEDRAAILSRSRELRKSGTESAAAAAQAVEELIAKHRQTLAAPAVQVDAAKVAGEGVAQASKRPAEVTVAPPAASAESVANGVPQVGQTAPETDVGKSLKERAEAMKAPKPTLTQHFVQQIQNGDMPKDNPALRKMVEAFDGNPATQQRMKVAQETLEAAIAQEARRKVSGGDVEAKFNRLLALYESQPLLNIRTSSSVENQAYSTPAPLAFLSAELAGITGKTTVLEPTAGTGMLLITADPSKVIANEIDPLRNQLLKDQGFAKVSDRDATERVTPMMVDRVITNPPFGPITKTVSTPAKLGGRITNADGTYYNKIISPANTEQQNIKVKVDGYALGQIDHLIAARALESMKDDGRATLILGANKIAGGVSNQDLIFFNWLYSHYNVTSHFEVDGKLYTRQGASWPVRVITIEGREKSDRIGPQAGVIQRAMTWGEVYEHYEQGLATGRAGRGLPAAPSGSQAAGPDVTQPVREPAGGQAAAPDGRGPAPGEAGNADVRGERPGSVVDPGAVPAQPVGERGGAQRPGDGADRQDRLGGDAGRPGTGKPDGNTRAARVAPAKTENALTPVENEFQAAYTPRSSRKDAGVLIPVNMQQPTQDALSALEDAVGDIDEYARKQLGYETTEQLHDALMGLQVDSVASAIYQMSREKGTIIADQTGIGKGRQAAAIIRWAVKNGRIPIFASVKPSLFTDMYGDLHDIGTDDVAPYILNSTESIKGAGDEKLFANKPSQHRKNLESIAEKGMLPEGRNALFMTYSQINVDNVQRRAVLALAPRAIFILDESHNAGGDSATGDFIKSSIDLGKGVVYLSATYAKRPDNMPLYFKTDMGEAVADDETLMNAMESGGLPLQTVVSNNLVKAGQMFRRERSFDGVEIRTETDTANREAHEKQSDAATSALRGIVAADRMFHEVYFKEMKKAIAKEGARALDDAGNQAKTSVDHTEFSSVVHNFVRQMLLGLEANKAADLAIAALQQGQKPLIALENTMGSFLNEYAENNRIRVGDSLGNFDYRTVLSRALERTRYYTKQLPNGDKVKVYVPMSELGSITQQAYIQAQETIDGLQLDIPVSPIDWMRDRLTKAGFSVAEITGRNLTVDYSDPKVPKLSQMDALEQKDKVRTTRQFNSGKLDAIILNVAGSTGISLHASEKFTDQRQRMMIVAQAAQDINIFMQMLGRIHRTGQVALPAYKLLNADLPAVKRPTALLAKKMKSLNANTSSNTESATSVQAFDMLNKYGDQVVDQYLIDNPNLAQALGLDGAEADETGESDGTADIARKMTGRLALLPVETQRAVYADLEASYGTMIDYLNKTNQNDLEPRTADFDAREMKSAVIFEGTNPASPFGQDAIYNEYSIKAQGKAPTPDEVRAEMAESLGGGGNTGKLHAVNLIHTLKQALEPYKATLNDQQKEQAEATASTARRFISEHTIGQGLRVEINGEPYAAVVTNIRSTHKTTGNPFSMSKIQVTLAINGALRGVTVPATRMAMIQTSTIGQYNLSTLFAEGPKDERQTAKIITGNLLGAYGELKGVKGTIISFTKEDGTIEQGILLPKAFDFSKNTQGDYRLPTGEAAVLFLRQSINRDIGRFGIGTRDGIVRVTPDGSGIRVQVPKSKAKGGKYFLDDNLRRVMGDFVTSGNFMVATVDGNDAAAALDVLMKKQALYTLPSMADEARSIIGETNLKSGTQSGDVVGNPDQSRSDRVAVDPNKKQLGMAHTAVQWLAANASQPWMRELATRMQPLIDQNTPIRFLERGVPHADVPTEVAQRFKGDIFGVSGIDPVSGKGRVFFRYSEARPISEDDLLHELVHVATQRALSITKSATIRADVESIRAVLGRTFDQILSSPRASEQARSDAAFFKQVMEDEHEFMAYGLTSPTFREWAQKLDENGRFMKEPTGNIATAAKPKLNLWQRFVDAVRSLVGLSKLYTPRLESLLEQPGHSFEAADTPRNLSSRLDSLLNQTQDLRVGPQEYAANWSPRRNGGDLFGGAAASGSEAVSTKSYLERLRAGDVLVPASGLSAEDKRGFKPLWEKGLAVVVNRDGQNFLRLGRGNWFEDATEQQQKTLDALPTVDNGDFHGLGLMSPTESLLDSAQASFEDHEVAPGVREVKIADVGPLLGGYDTAQESKRIDALAAAIKESGEIEPIFVGLDPSGEQYIMEGQHRVRALQKLGYETVPARVVVDMDRQDDTKAGTASFVADIRKMDQKDMRNAFLDAVTSHASTNLWERTIGTQYAKAQKNPKTFGRVFDAVQNYIKDTSVFANAAADRAPDILPKLDKMSDLWKDGLMEHGAKRGDIDAAGTAAFSGTLKWSRDEQGALVDNDAARERADALSTDQKARVLFKAGLVTEAELKRWQATPLDIYDGAVRNRYDQKLLRPGVVFSDGELRSLFKMNDKQIGLYRQFRSTIDQSLDDLGRSEVVRLAGKQVGDATRETAIGADSMAEAAQILSARIDEMTERTSSADERDRLTALRNDINDKANRVEQLKDEGYAPLMRFGEHTVDVVAPDGTREYFGMFESGMAANKMARQMRAEFPRATVTQGKLSTEGFKLYQGLDLNALELFAESTGNADNAVYQDFLRLTKNNRSAMKRLIERKGVSGFNENTSRVLASFVTSNSRMASGNLHMGEALSAASDIPKEMGDLKDEATKLIKYVQNPGQEAAGVRALLFTNFIGGSIASAMVNLTQPFTMSLPYLSQYGGAGKAAGHLLAAAKSAAGGNIASAELKAALKEHEDIVSPQEIHHLQSAAQDRLGGHPALKKAAFLWGSMFSLSEQFNRRVTFIAAFNAAKQQAIANPGEFARKAVIETQGLYNKGNKPNWSRGAIGATVMTFKQFSIHYLEFLNRMWKSGPEGKKAVGLALALLVLTAGAGGLPFADDLDDLIDTLAQALGYDFSSKKAKREFIASQLGDTAAEFITRGITGVSGMPIDVSLRMGMGNLIPATGVMLRSTTDRTRDVMEIGGAAGSLAKNVMDAGAQALQGNFGQAAGTVMPMAIQNMAKAVDMFNSGEYRNAKGQLVTNVDAVDAAAKFIGFNPGVVAQESMRQQEAQRSIALAKNVEGEIASKWAQGINENRPELVTEARAELADWNAKNDNSMRLTMQQIINKVREMRMTRADRTIKSAPREMRAAVRSDLQ